MHITSARGHRVITLDNACRLGNQLRGRAIGFLNANRCQVLSKRCPSRYLCIILAEITRLESFYGYAFRECMFF